MCVPLKYARDRARLTVEQLREEQDRRKAQQDRRTHRRHKIRNKFIALETKDELET
jgi:hypothetical protein